MGEARGREPSQEVIGRHGVGPIYPGNPFGFTAVDGRIAPLQRAPSRSVGAIALDTGSALATVACEKQAAVEEE